MDNIILFYIPLFCTILSCLGVVYNTYIHTIMDLEDIKRDAAIGIRKYGPNENLLEIYSSLVVFLLAIDIIQTVINQNRLIIGINSIIIALWLNALILRFYRYRRNVEYKPALTRIFIKQIEIIYIGFILLYIRFTTTKMK